MNDASPAPAANPVASPAEEEWTIAATAATALALYRPRTLKCGDTFLVLDNYGDAQALGNTAEGLFHNDTRYLSRMSLRLAGMRPLLLSSAVSQDNALLSVNMTNPDLFLPGGGTLKRDTVHIIRQMVLGPAVLQERIRLENFGDQPLHLELSLTHAADFADIFEVRGMKRGNGRGTRDNPVELPAGLRLRYTGLDGLVRTTLLEFSAPPDRRQGRETAWMLDLPAGGSQTLEITVRCHADDGLPAEAPGFDDLLRDLRRWSMRRLDEHALVHTSNAAFNDWIHRSQADLAMLTTTTPQGPFPYAGIPWFSCPFGRDSIISALQCLWADPELARGTLGFLAAQQATELDPKRDAEPGKILHEMRRGEMAALGEVPFGHYYGSVDSTPLFVVLAAAYAERTGDWALIRSVWPAVEKALGWMIHYGDPDGDGLLKYDRKSVNGLINQGWKDSFDSVFHADGRMAEAPIALIEVQAYAEAAWRGAARMATALGLHEDAAGWLERADRVRDAVDRHFWCEELGTYAIALDGDRQPCRVRNSNAGHALMTGLVPADKAPILAATLLDPSSFTGWGIRTIAEGEARYNPMSYHNGSVWPHDNGLIAQGLKRYNLHGQLEQLISGLFDTALAVDMKRLPELHCGFPRADAEGPTAYPVACLPQAWAAASAFAVLGAMLGISFRPEAGVIRFVHPILPSWLEELRIDNLRLNDSSVDVVLRRHGADGAVSLNVLGRRGDVEVAVIT
ncbi:amylo-alpha-1,6-glucosidase [Roseomonas elaeocarpi]|uniref:Glycogen debranching N-terminal domain-containing protein n=1 Tax=Roseomonas elaeocarpi TaxID=907779 RepID=A0ABV6JRC4_9PROT